MILTSTFATDKVLIVGASKKHTQTNFFFNKESE